MKEELHNVSVYTIVLLVPKTSRAQVAHHGLLPSCPFFTTCINEQQTATAKGIDCYTHVAAGVDESMHPAAASLLPCKNARS